MSNESKVVRGVDLHFIPEQPPKDSKKKIVHTMLRLLCDDWNGGWLDFLDIPALSAILIKEDPKFIALLNQGLKDGFMYLLNQLQGLKMTPDLLLRAQIYIQNCLCFLPYTNPELNETIVLPEWIDNKWQPVTYTIEPMLLTSPPKCGSFFTQPSDQFYAFGLKPVDKDLPVRAKLVFQASAYPAGKGFWIAVKSDMKAFQTPGNDLLKSGQRVIDNWVNQLDRPVDFVGISLGAIMAITAAIANGKVTKVHAYNPPGYYGQDLAKLSDKQIPEVHVIRNAGEPASELGSFDPRFKVHLLTPKKEYQSKLFLIRHALSFANKGSTKFTELDVESLNRDNHHRNIVYGPIRALGDLLLIKPLDLGRAIAHIPSNIICRLKS
ncbi:hypothetical protein [Legionella sp. W05-934-2]|jgi:hypothetical protein|uniref:hypothetical protein n=1 Tax=Legionella sp. W05-934-2 TaxID=1198649 RepID=UPI0034626286